MRGGTFHFRPATRISTPSPPFCVPPSTYGDSAVRGQGSGSVWAPHRTGKHLLHRRPCVGRCTGSHGGLRGGREIRDVTCSTKHTRKYSFSGPNRNHALCQIASSTSSWKIHLECRNCGQKRRLVDLTTDFVDHGESPRAERISSVTGLGGRAGAGTPEKPNSVARRESGTGYSLRWDQVEAKACTANFDAGWLHHNERCTTDCPPRVVCGPSSEENIHRKAKPLFATGGSRKNFEATPELLRQ